MAGDCPIEDGYALILHLNLCFKAYPKKYRWLGARNSCRNKGSRLIILDTEEKHTAVREYIKTNIDEAQYWIGLNDRLEESVFLWENGNNVNFSMWGLTSPNNEWKTEDCVMLSVEQNWWNDVNCNLDYKYICEHSI
ncbi:C-type lectin-like [Gigantopelta aegis]|uniref:C-type lectin-like n=1 Tax=Gigantopelta aegis TaxID=1735272 RepID=UPI001B88C3A3|nr:C-type lectin-like [Gigantopelta aegis]